MSRLDGWSVRRFAGVGIAAQFAALVRTLSEVFRIKYFDPDHNSLAGMEPFVGAALVTAVLLAVAVAAFAIGRYRASLVIAFSNISALFVYKVLLM